MRTNKIVRSLIFTTAMFTAVSARAKLEVHEWGTFTSLVGSDGITLHGMYHEDEVLPDFVHPFGATQAVSTVPPQEPDHCPPFTKFCFFQETLERNIISQKMETPVIYFYGDPPSIDRHVKVNVKFPEGVITETFPAPVSSYPQNSPQLMIANG